MERYGIIMHISYLPTGQRSCLKEPIQMQISNDMKSQEEGVMEGEYDLG